MRTERFRKTTGCTRCKKELADHFGCCPDCGGTFMGGEVTHQYIVKEYFVPIETVWYKPSTWGKNTGYWTRLDYIEELKK